MLIMLGVDKDGEPTRPDLNIIRVNVDGTLYTWKLAVHYFRQQPDVPERDRCFIMTGSMVSWIDSPGNWEYTASKVIHIRVFLFLYPIH